jgi:cob(I)alamin adenosyltransferase
MVKLNKIYTRTGDDGTTSLVGGGRVSKHARRPSAFGEVDELNSVLGLARLYTQDVANLQQLDSQIARIQNDLFDLGADLATADETIDALRITQAQVKRLEKEIDAVNANLQPLTSFILPGGMPLAAWLHLGRTVARRAERRMTELAVEEPVNEAAMQYINRVSDLLFVLARNANGKGERDVLWVPGDNQSD